MGYSVMVEFPEVEVRDKVLAFLEKNLTPPHKLLGEDVAYVRGPVSDPSYDRDEAKDRLIGFDFTTSAPPESRIAYMLCYWMARHVNGTSIWYDGLDKIEIPESCDEHGFEPLESLEHRQAALSKNPVYIKMMEIEAREIAALNEPVRAELVRLSELWRQEV